MSANMEFADPAVIGITHQGLLMVEIALGVATEEVENAEQKLITKRRTERNSALG